MNKQFVLLVLMSLANSVPSVWAADFGGVESLVLSDGAIKLVAKVETSQSREDCPSASSWRWGSEAACPRRRIASLDVAFGGSPVFVPYSALADLGNPNSIRIERGDKDRLYSISIGGGDAGTAYSAVLKFKGGLLLEKLVRHGEFPESAWERTVYRFNVTQ